jgi:pyrroloquinoline quinone (PQQ) biosynthesis protein C
VSDQAMIRITSHPEWVEDFLGSIKTDYDKVVNHQLFTDINDRKLSREQFHFALINFYPLIETFPTYMALNLAKVPLGRSEWSVKTRYWLITNMELERLHARWWRQFAAGFRVRPEIFDSQIYPPPQMDAINNYLWHVCTQGSLAEGIGAANFAIEGPTGKWAKNVLVGIENYRGVDGIDLNENTLEWITAHAHYDDKHPEEALEIVKAYAVTAEEQMKVRRAAKRALEYYALALDACYESF